MAKKIFNFITAKSEEDVNLPLLIPDETSVKEFNFPKEMKNTILDVVRPSDSYRLTCTQTLKEKE